MGNVWSADLGGYQSQVDDLLARMANDQIIRRIWDIDHTVWKDDPTEITNRLGWLRIADEMIERLGEIESLVSEVRNDGYTHALLLGMGGSSLAPEVFRKTFGVRAGSLDLAILDSTSPEMVSSFARTLDPSKTLFIVATKSGGTAETLSFFKFFYNKVSAALGSDRAGEHFIAITDPGSRLETMAAEYGFRHTFLNNPNIGGRYSALSFFGLVPAALIGVDTRLLLSRAADAGRSCSPDSADNPGAWLGAVMGGLAEQGRDKITFMISPEIESFGDWVEQLIAESTGKEGKGILPVVGERPSSPEAYGDDRLFVQIALADNPVLGDFAKSLAESGHPVVKFSMDDKYDIAGQFFIWELATAVAGYVLGINPFDQPDVESAKVQARRMIAEYTEKGALPKEEPLITEDGITLYGDEKGESVREILDRFLSRKHDGDYIAVQAYVQPTDETTQALQELRSALFDRLHIATTVGYGPRFLHSTGQLHKGDSGKGMFIQITTDATEDVPIPDAAGSDGSSISFGVLITAQAMGDRSALNAVGRRVIQVHLEDDVADGIRRIAKML